MWKVSARFPSGQLWRYTWFVRRGVVMKVYASCLLAVILVATGCSSDGEGSAPEGLPHRDMYEAVQASALLFSCTNGDWAEDFGDAAYYGPSFFVAAGQSYGRPDYVERGHAGLVHNLDVIRKGNADLGYLMANLDEILMAALGLVEVSGLEGGSEGLEDLDRLLDTLNAFVGLLGYYVNLDAGSSYAMQTYGPTAVTAVVAMLNLRYAQVLDTPRVAERKAIGIEIVNSIDANAWDGTRYLIGPSDDALEIYPQVSMIIANATAFLLTGEARYRDRAVVTHRAMQPLKDPVKKNYRSPYSARTMGAKSDDYSTLSSQNYAMMALALLFQITDNDAYKDEVADLIDFLYRHLFVDGRLLHHWMDGRVAVPSDPEYFCTGCNFQYLYVMWYVEQNLFGGR